MSTIVKKIDRGPAYPFRFDTTTGQVVLSSGDADIRDCLVRLLSTEPGEEPFLYRNGVPYGVRTSQALFADVDSARGILEFEIRAAIDAWEPRVVVTDVQLVAAKAQKAGGAVKMQVVVTYRVRATSREDNLVVSY